MGTLSRGKSDLGGLGLASIVGVKTNLFGPSNRVSQFDTPMC